MARKYAAICSVEACSGPHASHGFCSRHDQRFRKYGDPLGQADHIGRPRTPTPARFFAKVRKVGHCWEWQAARDKDGYGMIRHDDGTGYKFWKVHRVSYEFFVGKIPEGLTIDHLCRNHPCVNPLHLEAVTGRENTMRGISFAAINARKTHCSRGHEYSPENTRIRSDGARDCWICYRAYHAEWNRKKREQAAFREMLRPSLCCGEITIEGFCGGCLEHI